MDWYRLYPDVAAGAERYDEEQPDRGRAVLSEVAEGYWLGGISTVSIMYTVAFAV